MSESFAELFEESLKTLNLQAGSIITGVIVDIDYQARWVTVHAGLKSEALIPLEQFYNDAGDLTINVGDEVHVALDSVEDGFGETKLSREKAKRAECWIVLEAAFAAEEVVKGVINGKVKGGFTVDVNGIRAFLPGSLVDVRPVRDTTHLEGKELEFKVIKLDQKRNNVVVSRRSVLEAENSAEREALLESLQEGQQVKGIVKNLTDYGAFVDLGGVDGLLHITDMAWKRIKHPSEIVNVGDEIDVKVLKYDRERNRVSLGLKQLGEDPWVAIKARYPESTRVTARVTNLTDYGCFAELEEGVEGLVHVSEMDWTNKNIHPSKVVQVGDEVEVMVLDIDEERRRISLGIKQCKSNPWEDFSGQFNKGDKISGTIKSITDFGIFIGLDGGIDGLVHLSDISWNEVGEEAVRRFKKGDELDTVILSVDPERERISLGIKQLESDPFSEYVQENDKGAIVKGTVKEVDAKGAIIVLADDIEATLKASEISRDRVEDARNVLKEGQEVEAKIISVDRKSRVIQLSIKSKDEVEEKEAIQSLKEAAPEAAADTTMAALLRQAMAKQN
ncbi:MAG: 30S ribosomal protein S1 [Pseudomonadales bacterium RIFCSPLOWO2_12_60_38]|uniref:30S ribosomal protein S1 n=10 Tax=Pseudomonas TaxID=286 RepID=A0A109KZR3_PSEFL|nr:MULTISPECIES: 30S ribosomal protein S1 [Pseudomonas]AFJ58294.1 ribosomal protein S1 [Pseudomonas fluorescens A506]ETK41798.1 30S ribosomal protein S1 [Pseudomonas fluorescens FH5]MDN5428692.1 30S ribosomal protein S1 [Pseudomonadales bacterium]OHC32543.1 MAG: 30S ribosomal protein S1 [Pseudomonadales bacterium RIFCSPLOWO2_12_60_38]OHC42476.1 MAG: 30S ribosomal protein S1 [Pseudomonadales bacterium RIFCSPLOWO2_12_FULL_59_450]PMZ71670.1 30S ribosomal protein S1 [Pseudomonas sp. GW247-3R2A]R